MKKSLYSLILSDGVIREIDKLAYKTNTNRSSLINRILAEYVSYTTPEMRMDSILKELESFLLPSDNFKLLLNNSLSCMNMRSSLDYKYNPSVKYTVELLKDDSDDLGALKVSLRSQNANLISYMIEFYKLFASIECKYLQGVKYTLDDDKFTRTLTPRGDDEDPQTLGRAIARYVKVFDNCLKLFFSYVNDTVKASYEIERAYVSYLRSAEALI